MRAVRRIRVVRRYEASQIAQNHKRTDHKDVTDVSPDCFASSSDRINLPASLCGCMKTAKLIPDNGSTESTAIASSGIGVVYFLSKAGMQSIITFPPTRNTSPEIVSMVCLLDLRMISTGLPSKSLSVVLRRNCMRLSPNSIIGPKPGAKAKIEWAASRMHTLTRPRCSVKFAPKHLVELNVWPGQRLRISPALSL